MEFFVLLVFLGFAGAVILYKVLKSRSLNRAWKQAAQDLGLNFSPGGFLSNREMRGTYKTYPIRIWMYTEGGKHKTTYTVAKIDFRDLPFDLNLQRDGFLQSIGTFFGAQDVRIGEQAFDQKVVVKGQQTERIRSFLTGERVSALNRFFRAFPHGTVTDRMLRAEREGTAHSSREIKAIASQCVRLARLLEGERSEREQTADDAFNRGMTARNEGDLETAREAFEQSAERDPENVDALLHKADLLEMDENYHHAAQAYLNALEKDPNDPRIRKSYRRVAGKAGISEKVIEGTISSTVEETDEAEKGIRSPSSKDGGDRPQEASIPEAELAGTDAETGGASPATVADTTAGEGTDENQSESEDETKRAPSAGTDSPAAEGEPASGAPDKTETLQALFDPQSTSVEVGQRFENEYRGREVEWTAAFLERKDLDFCLQFDGDREGGLIKVLLHRGDRDTAVTRDCYGFVHLPDGVPDALKEGDDVTFTGTLFRLDDFMRNLYVSQGAVTN